MRRNKPDSWPYEVWLLTAINLFLALACLLLFAIIVIVTIPPMAQANDKPPFIITVYEIPKAPKKIAASSAAQGLQDFVKFR